MGNSPDDPLLRETEPTWKKQVREIHAVLAALDPSYSKPALLTQISRARVLCNQALGRVAPGQTPFTTLRNAVRHNSIDPSPGRIG